LQIIFKIGEFKPKKKADLINVFKYITRESAVYKAKGIGVSSNPDIAIRQFMINKRKYKKAIDEKYRFAYHEILSFEAGTDPELAYKITEDYCKNLHYKKGFNCYFAIQTDTDNVHAHIIVDSVNFKTGNMLISENEKELEKRPELKNKIEFYSLEQQMKFAEDMAIKNGYEIEDEKRYAFMHEAKKNDKNARKWLTKNQYQTFKKEEQKEEDKSWRNLIKEKIEEMYKRSDITEQNIGEIAKEYGLEVTRHNAEKQTITFALLDTEGKRTKQRLKLVEQINKKKKKGEEVAVEDVKLAIKMERLEEQERGNFASEDINIFTYSNFFGGKKKEEIEKREETREEILEFFAKEKEKLRIRLEAEAKAKEDIKPVEKEDIKTPVNTYIVEDSKPMNFELEKEYQTYKDTLDNFYKDQEDKKKEQDSKAKKLEQEIKDIEKAEIDKITQADEVLRRLNIEEEERQAESKAKQEEEKKVAVAEIVESKLTITDSKQELTNSESVVTDSNSIITNSKPIITVSDYTVTNSESLITSSKQEEQEEKQDLESKQVDLDSLIEKIDSYKLVEEYNLYDTLPAFQIITDELIYDSSSGEGDIELAKSLIENQKGEEYWDNMNVKDITKWEEVEVFTIAYNINDDIQEYKGFKDYSKSTIKQFLEENTTITEELAKQYMQDSDSKTKDSKDYEVEKKKDREIDFN
jgi:exonuclease SbcC